MKLSALAAAAAILVTSIGAAAPADAQRMRERTVVRTTTVVHADRGRHLGWRNHQRRQVCRTMWRHHHRERVCTSRRW